MFPNTIIGDEMRLKQILINLVKNALKFTRRGVVKILLAFDRPTCMLWLSVIDSGCGIREEEKPRLFSMFGKLLRTAQMNHEGIGMGLMICSNLVKHNNGEIILHSDGDNKGSNFTFSMQMENGDKIAEVPINTVASKESEKIDLNSAPIMTDKSKDDYERPA